MLVKHNVSITVVEKMVCPENGGGMMLKNVGNHLPHRLVTQKTVT